MTDSDQTQTCEAGEQDSAEQRRLSGRARVRALLIEPLVADGLIRHRGTTVEAHVAFLDKLAARLA